MQSESGAKSSNQELWPPAGVNWYYAEDGICIAHGDCRDILPHLPEVDLVFTSPPYNMRTRNNP